MADWGPVLVAVVLFVLLTPGLLCQVPGNGHVVGFCNMQTSGLSIFVHTVLFFGLITIFLIAIDIATNSLQLTYTNQIEVYSSESGPWRLSGAPFTAPKDTILFSRGVFVNGVVHWICNRGSSLCFNVGEERVRESPMPQVPNGRNKRMVRYFGESKEHLHLVEVYGPTTSQFHVYEVERDYSKWFVKYNVDLHAVQVAFPEMIWSHFIQYCYEFSILCIVGCGIEEESYLVLNIPGKVLRYNLKDKSFVKICDLGSNVDPVKNSTESYGSEGSLEFRWFDAYQYIESLSCV